MIDTEKWNKGYIGEKVIKPMYEDGSFPLELADQITDAINKQIPGIATNDWIPCSERLPKDYVPVLTCDCKGNIHVMYHIDFYKKPFNIDRHNKKYHMVKAWQPLPEPYKGKSR